jgi:hypothetical protein
MFSKETGIVVIATGMGITTLGSVLLFDKALVIAGHILTLIGMAMLFKSKTFALFQPEKLQGTSFFVLGLTIIFFKYHLLGFLLEIVGIFLIFKSTLPSFKDLFFKILFRSKKLTS